MLIQAHISRDALSTEGGSPGAVLNSPLAKLLLAKKCVHKGYSCRDSRRHSPFDEDDTQSEKSKRMRTDGVAKFTKKRGNDRWSNRPRFDGGKEFTDGEDGRRVGGAHMEAIVPMEAPVIAGGLDGCKVPLCCQAPSCR